MSSRQLGLWKRKQEKGKQQTVEGSSGSVSREWVMPEKDFDFEYFDELLLTPPKEEVEDTPKSVGVGATCVADDAIKIPKDKLGDMLVQMMMDDGIRREDIRRIKDGDETRFGYVTRDTETGVEEIVLFKK